MPGKILGIDISEYNISVVQVISGLKGYEVISCFSTPVADKNLEKALEELSSRLDIKSDKCFLTVPIANTSFRNVSTPFKDSKKIRQTLPFEIETLVPFAVDERIIDYIHTDESNPESILTAAVKKDYIGDYIEQLKNAGIEPDIIDIRPVPAVAWLLEQERTPGNGVYLDLEPEHPCIVIIKNKKTVLIRELPCSFSEEEKPGPEENKPPLLEPVQDIINTICREADRTLYSFSSNAKDSFTAEKVFFGGRLSAHNNTSDILNQFFKTPVERINISRDNRLKMDAGLSGIYKPALMDNALAMAIHESKKSIGFNFRRDEFAVKRKFLGPGKDVRRIALLIGIFIVLMFINGGVDYYYLSKKHALAEERFNKEFDKKLPDQKGIKDIRLRLSTVTQRLNEINNPSDNSSDGIKPNQKVTDIWLDIYKRIGNSYTLDINDFRATNRKEIKITGITDSYDTVDKIRKALETSDLYKKVGIKTPERTEDGVKIEITLDMTD